MSGNNLALMHDFSVKEGAATVEPKEGTCRFCVWEGRAAEITMVSCDGGESRDG